jgi:hypothetical protein
MYHGWSDPQVTPLNSVSYYKNVLKTVGNGACRRSYRSVHGAGNEPLLGGTWHGQLSTR